MPIELIIKGCVNCFMHNYFFKHVLLVVPISISIFIVKVDFVSSTTGVSVSSVNISVDNSFLPQHFGKLTNFMCVINSISFGGVLIWEVIDLDPDIDAIA